MNSVYFLTMNVSGDGRNVWPWTGPTAFDRFDVSKLAQWEIVFEHAQSLGIQLHVVLQETENDHLLDRGDLGPDRKRYLREMVARFAHHPAVQWNLGEENTQTPEQVRAMSEFIKGLDAYGHPVALHNDHWSPDNVFEAFEPHIRTDTLDVVSMQCFEWSDVPGLTKLLGASRTLSYARPWVITGDELGGANFGLRTDAEEPDHVDARRRGLWGNLMGGGAGVEWYFGWQNNSPHSDLSAEDWRPREAMYRQSALATAFLQRHVPFDEMEPAGERTIDPRDYVLKHPRRGDLCIYRPDGGSTRAGVSDENVPWLVTWWNPREGGPPVTVDSPRWGPGVIATGEPPSDPEQDWVVLVRRSRPIFTGGDVIAVEAEHFENQRQFDARKWHVLTKSEDMPDLEGAGDPLTWVRSADSAATQASGRRFVRALPDTRKTHDDRLVQGTNFFPEPGAAGVLSYRVRFPEAGRYYVWVRAFSTGTEDNGLHVGLDDEWPESGQRMQWCEGKNRWTWGCAQRTEANHCGEPMQIWLDVPEAGEHTVRFSMREDGFAFDKFLLTRDVDYRPQGEGPGERLALDE